jgi:hypothetical protein
MKYSNKEQRRQLKEKKIPAKTKILFGHAIKFRPGSRTVQVAIP